MNKLYELLISNGLEVYYSQLNGVVGKRGEYIIYKTSNTFYNIDYNNGSFKHSVYGAKKVLEILKEK